MKNYFTKIHYENNFISSFLSIFSIFYLILIKARLFFYKINILKSHKLQAYTISVGNLTTGGTGKTPITCEIAKYITEKFHKKTAILSRGYGGKLSNKNTNLISDGEKIYFSADLAGDEPYWFAQNLQNVVILTGKDRVNTGKFAINNFKSEVLILDDGFQYLRFKRDINILVIDCTKKFGNDFLLPAGPLRETISEVKRADKIIVVNKKPFDKQEEINCLEFIEDLKQKFNKPVHLCKFTVDKIYNIKDATLLDYSTSNKIYAFTGIAQPEFFFGYIRDQNLNLIYERIFSDHHLYTKNDIDNILKQAQDFDADIIITTEKDAVKLTEIIDKVELKMPIYVLKLKLDIDLDSLIELDI